MAERGALIQPFAEVASLGNLERGDRDPSVAHLRRFLQRFGYLSLLTDRLDVLDDATCEALGLYQARHALPLTQAFDANTRASMTTSRCAMPDVSGGVAFTTTCAWDRRDLRYAFGVGTESVAGTEEFAAVRAAFATWSAATELTFGEVPASEDPDLFIEWRTAADPDLSMVGGTVAHADFPPGCSIVTDTLPKPIHFDDSEHAWSIGATVGAFDVETVALHEIGHILGLGHSDVPGAVMWPSVSDNATLRELHADDIEGVSALYPRES